MIKAIIFGRIVVFLKINLVLSSHKHIKKDLTSNKTLPIVTNQNYSNGLQIAY